VDCDVNKREPPACPRPNSPSLTSAPFRPGELPLTAWVPLDHATRRLVSERAREAALPTELWVRIAVEASRLATEVSILTTTSSRGRSVRMCWPSSEMAILAARLDPPTTSGIELGERPSDPAKQKTWTRGVAQIEGLPSEARSQGAEQTVRPRAEERSRARPPAGGAAATSTDAESARPRSARSESAHPWPGDGDRAVIESTHLDRPPIVALRGRRSTPFGGPGFFQTSRSRVASNQILVHLVGCLIFSYLSRFI